MKLTLQRKLAPKSVKVVRPTLYSYIYTREEFDHYSNKLFNMIEEKKLDVRIYNTYPLSEVATAHTVSLLGPNPLGCVRLIIGRILKAGKLWGSCC